jgi:integrase
LRQRYPGSWSIILDLGYEIDATTEPPTRRRKQKWVTFKSSPGLSQREQRTQAEAKLTELQGAVNGGTFVEPSKTTLITFLRDWLEKSVKPPMRRASTYALYRSVIEKHLSRSSVALVPLQKLRASHLERYLADVPVAAGSLAVHHSILHRALRKAVKDGLLTVSPAGDLERRRAKTDRAEAARSNCWSPTEARCFLETARTADPQMSAFAFLALDSGARKSELHGLAWAHIDFDSGVLLVERQLLRAGVEPIFGPTKTGGSRSLSLGEETIEQLRIHRQAQLELKMKNRTTYKDFGLVFAKQAEDVQRPLDGVGQPLRTLGEARFQRLVKQAGVKRIKFHGCRHSCASLLLQAGVPPHVVAARLGHSVIMLMRTYAHALPNQQQDAAVRLSTLLHG